MAIILVGHRAWHCVTPHRQPEHRPGRELALLLFSAVSWTNAGEAYPAGIDAARASTRKEEYVETRELQTALATLRLKARVVLGTSPPDAQADFKLKCDHMLKQNRRKAFFVEEGVLRAPQLRTPTDILKVKEERSTYK